MRKIDITEIIKEFIKSLNAFDVETALTLFAANALIDDVSVGEKFKNIAGVRQYLEQFFVGYKTVTKLESIEVVDNLNAKTQVDFTGDFGHETGTLNVTLNADGLITAIAANLD